MKINILYVVIVCILSFACQESNNKKVEAESSTICNPLNLSYKYRSNEPSRREAADPSVIIFKDEYYLFASMSGGYWYSLDLVNWIFVETNEIPTEDYAPTAITINDTVYFLASTYGNKNTIYMSADPKSGNWEIAKDSVPFIMVDPAFYQDDDNRLYLYWGCSNMNPLYGIELDYRNNFEPVGDVIECLNGMPEIHGWEQKGDYNNKPGRPWIEGVWLNKYEGKYYLQYAGPGTEYKSYADGVYVSDSPLGPFTYAKHNPTSYKPEGYACGAGHGSTIKDIHGNYWHFGTVTISQKQMFERRLAMFPTFFDKDGLMHTYTGFGDYPFIMPDHKIKSPDELSIGWMLLSYNKQAKVSSLIDSLPVENALNEDIRSYWAAKSGNSDEWFMVDLEKEMDIHAIQVNFYEHETNLFGRDTSIYYQFIIEASNDMKNWEKVVDKSNNRNDRPHDYIQLKEKETARYIRLTNIRVPDGNLALSGFRVFGKANGNKPKPIERFEIERDNNDTRVVNLKWEKVQNATGYNIRFGIAPDKLYHNYMVYGNTSLEIRSLNKNQTYYFTIDVFNESGISHSTYIKKII